MPSSSPAGPGTAAQPEIRAGALRELAAATAGEEDLARLLLQASRAVRDTVVERLIGLGHEGVRPAHASVFMHLEPEGSRIVTLAARAEMTRQGMASLVKELEAAGHVRVEPDPGDGRASKVVLTERGAAFCHAAAAVVREVEDEWARLLGREGVAGLRRTLRALVAGAPVA